MSEPIVYAAQWRAVMEAAGYRCQCSGRCGNPHAKGEGRCPKQHGEYTSKRGHLVRLVAAPADPATSETDAAGLGPGELRAWCPECFAHAERSARRTAGPEPQPTLFDLADEGDAA